MKKQPISILFSALLLAGSGFAAEELKIGVVNFGSCIAESKFGKKEQENIENIRKQLTSRIETAEKELQELSAKFEDSEFLDSLSPKAQEELNLKYQTLQEEHARSQSHLYQFYQQAQYQLVQNMSGKVNAAASNIAKQKDLDYILNKDICFYIRPDLDCTTEVIGELNKNFDLEKSKKKLSENGEVIEDLELGEIASDELGQ